jgi:hypothetical protein
MSTEEHYDGEVHGLLATAFDDHVPPVDLVSGAVDGYRRHKRRARVFGTAGGALALTGAVLGGTALVGTGSSGASDGTSAASGTSTPGSGAAPTVESACAGLYNRFSTQPGTGDYTADSATLAQVCSRDLAALRTALPKAKVTPRRESWNQASAAHDAAPGVHLPPGTAADTPLVQSGMYTVEINGRSATVELTVAREQSWGFTGCTSESCAPNLSLADGTPATEGPAATREVGVGMLSIRVDATHWVLFAAYAQKALPFDFAAVERSAPFAAAVSADVRDLNLPG